MPAPAGTKGEGGGAGDTAKGSPLVQIRAVWGLLPCLKMVLWRGDMSEDSSACAGLSPGLISAGGPPGS